MSAIQANPSDFFRGNLAELYEAVLVPCLSRPWAGKVLDRLKDTPPPRLLDVACGTGLVAREAKARFGAASRVIGIDLSNDMLEVARRLEDQVEWQHGDALNLPFGARGFDVVICQQGLQFFADKEKALREMYRVLAPEGQLALVTWWPLDGCLAYQALRDCAHKRGWSETAHLLNTAFSMPSTEVTGLVGHCGFVDIHHEDHMVPTRFESCRGFVEFYAQVPPLALDWGDCCSEERAAVISEIEARLGDWESEQGLQAPMTASLVTAKRPTR